MKKRLTSLAVAILILVTACLPVSAAAYSTDPNTNCTYIAWKMAADRGYYVPETWGNASSWYASAQWAGYRTIGPNEIPPANSIACWGGGLNGWGHVAYVVSADASVVNIGEGGRGYSATQPKYETFNYNYMRSGRWAQDAYGNRYSQYLQGYICLGSSTAAAPKLTLDKPWTSNVGNQNAVVYTVIRSGGAAVGCPKFGFQIWEKNSGKLLYTHSEAIPSYLQSGTYVNAWLDLQKELGLTLTPGTEYSCQFSAEKGGKTFQSEKITFKTTGTAPSAASAGNLALDTPWAVSVTGSNAEVHTVIRNGGAAVGCPKFGFQIWEKSTGKLLYTHSEAIPANLQRGTYVNAWLDLQKELGLTLKAGTEYTYQFSAEKNGVTVKSSVQSFKTAGSVSSPISWDNPWATDVSRTNAVVHTVLRNSGAAVGCSRFGFQIWEKNGNKLIYTHSEAIPASIQHYTYNNVWLDLHAELGLTLKAGTEYTYQFSTEKNGVTVKSAVQSFRTAY